MRGEWIFGERADKPWLVAKRKRMSLIPCIERNISSGSSSSQMVIRRWDLPQGNFLLVREGFIQGVKSFPFRSCILGFSADLKIPIEVHDFYPPVVHADLNIA